MIVLIVSKGYIPMNVTLDSRQSNTERILILLNMLLYVRSLGSQASSGPKDPSVKKNIFFFKPPRSI